MDTLKEFQERLRVSRKYCQQYWDKFIESYKYYLGHLTTSFSSEEEYLFNSKIVLPIAYDIVETQRSRIIGQEPEFIALAREPSDVPSEQSVTNLVNFEYRNPRLELKGDPLHLKVSLAVQEALITGFSILRPYWRRETINSIRYLISHEKYGIKDSEDIEKVYQRAKKDGLLDEIKWGKKTVETPFLDDFDLQNVPFFHFFVDPSTPETGRVRYVIYKDIVTFEDLINEAPIYGYDESVLRQIKKDLDDGKFDHLEGEPESRFLTEYFDLYGKTSYIGDDKTIKLLPKYEMWEDDRLVVAISDKYILRDGKNPYNIKTKPFIPVFEGKMNYQFFGRGAIEPIKRIADAVTDLYNMRFDNLVMAIMNMFLVNPNLLSDGDEFVPIPNSITNVKDVDRAIRVISGKDVTASSYKEAEALLQMIDRATGVNDYVRGVEGERLAGRTYQGLRLVQEAANARFEMKARLLERTSLKAIGYFILEMGRQFIGKDRIERILGREGLKEEYTIRAVDLKKIKGFMDVEVIPASSQMVDKQMQALKMNAVVDRIGRPPFDQIPREVLNKIAFKFWQAYGIVEAPYWYQKLPGSEEKPPAPKKNEENRLGIPTVLSGGRVGEVPSSQEIEQRIAQKAINALSEGV